MQSLTQREFEARLTWIESDLNNPSRDDWYSMQVAAEIRKLRIKKEVNLTDLKLVTSKPEVPKSLPSKEEISLSKSKWFNLLGIKGK